MGWTDTVAALPIAERAALAGDPVRQRGPLGAPRLGCVYLLTRRFDDSLAEFEWALRLDPNFSLAQGIYGLTLAFCGHWEQADEASRRALRLSPRDPFAALYYGIASYAQFVGRNYDEAVRLARAIAPITSAATVFSPPPPAWPERPTSPRPRSRSCAARSPISRSPGSRTRCRSGRTPTGSTM
jgi:tetratricopeptide (TPR) repeat protein